MSRRGLLGHILCEWQLVRHYLDWVWVILGGWGIILGGWVWIGKYFGWLGVVGWGWMGVSGGEWGWVHYMIMPNEMLFWILHFRIFTFSCVYFLSCSFERQWNVDMDKTKVWNILKWSVSFFCKIKGEGCSHWPSIIVQSLTKTG